MWPGRRAKQATPGRSVLLSHFLAKKTPDFVEFCVSVLRITRRIFVSLWKDRE